MNVQMILICSLFLYVLYSSCNEGYINKPLKDEPDDMQFLACHDYSSNQNLGNNNYKLKRHGVSEPLQGTYSYFLDTYKIRDYNEIFHAPICEEEYKFKDIGNLKVPEIFCSRHSRYFERSLMG